MKTLLSKLSVTKLSFLLVISVLCFLAIYAVMSNIENETLKTILTMFGYAVTSMISFYFGQKVAEVKGVDSLIKED
ncbi:MAG TPA: hypothetical protein PLP73_01195 [Candidatus Absconditabacterales bacterium]|nr:hypothetical protein [Candidatus Absconditabacterales bacterium]